MATGLLSGCVSVVGATARRDEALEVAFVGELLGAEEEHWRGESGDGVRA